jgi:tRNA (guanine-N7-)-methyltransferase
MPRLKLKRFKVKQPSPDALARYLCVFDPKDLYYRPDTVPSIPALFSRAQPLALDLGCGRGEFLVRQAAARQEINFAGIDWHLKSLWDGVNRAHAAGLDNVRFIKADLRLAFFIVPDQSVSLVTMLFPPTSSINPPKRKSDPLPETALRHIHRVLKPGESFHFVSDHPDYFAWKRAMIEDFGLFEVVLVQRGFEGGQTRFQRIWENFEIESLRLECRKNNARVE